MNMSPVEFRETYDGTGMLQHFRNEVIIPYAGILKSFRPAASSPGWVTRHQNQAVRKKA